MVAPIKFPSKIIPDCSSIDVETFICVAQETQNKMLMKISLR